MSALAFGETIPATWARTATDPEAFAREQEKLSHLWTFLGFTKDVANDGDWFRASLATRSVFVQRFGTELRGFENRCVHRFYPLRTEDKGNGPVLCGFHHWRYNKDGLALGIPLCEELYGVIPRKLNARLTPIEVATCGSLVFGRFPGPGATETLEEYLGEGFPILAAMAQMKEEPMLLSNSIKANWKLCLHITFDDYHGMAVHPSTFGKRGYVHRKNITYQRFGLHSTFLSTREPNPLQKMSAECREGTFRSKHYRIFQFMPDLLISHFKAYAQYWYCQLQQYVPVAHDRTEMRAWLYAAPFPADHKPHVKWTRPIVEPWRRRIVHHYAKVVAREDNEVCEKVQTIAHQIHERPILGALEERIGWFEESYAKALAAGEGSATPASEQREVRAGTNG
ncbi:MAG TPA: SRPBCC family protein [Pseudolabrys sp.]|nr:SRPBCC family protein [Pseudolabrys sp.]